VRAVDGRPAVRTQADAGTEPDPWLASLAGEKVWVVRAAIPHAGRAVNQLRQPLARGVGGSAVLIALVAAWLVEIWRVPSPPCPALPPPRPWSWSRAARATVVVAGAVLGTGLASRRPRRG
ncbi:MAG: hypothetical protein ACRD0D_15185, partial [Acidimicrobiales bacterium]